MEPNTPGTPDPNDAAQPPSLQALLQQAQARVQDIWHVMQTRTAAWPPAARVAAVAGVALVSLCLICTVCSAGLAALGGGSKAGGATVAGATNTPNKPTATSTPAVKATNTPSSPTKVKGPYLGTAESDFQAKYGAPVLKASLSRQYHATINGQQVFIAVTLENRGTDTERLRFIRVAPLSSSTKWNAATADAIARIFLPPDAQFQKDANVADFGKEHIYLSANLGVSFPADFFTLAADGSQLTLGTHYYSCGNTDEPQGGCSMQTGAL